MNGCSSEVSRRRGRRSGRRPGELPDASNRSNQECYRDVRVCHPESADRASKCSALVGRIIAGSDSLPQALFLYELFIMLQHRPVESEAAGRPSEQDLGAAFVRFVAVWHDAGVCGQSVARGTLLCTRRAGGAMHSFGRRRGCARSPPAASTCLRVRRRSEQRRAWGRGRRRERGRGGPSGLITARTCAGERDSARRRAQARALNHGSARGGAHRRGRDPWGASRCRSDRG